MTHHKRHVTLRPITEENYDECLNLQVADNQKDFVATNQYSLAQAWVFYETAHPSAIYADDVMAGSEVVMRIKLL